MKRTQRTLGSGAARCACFERGGPRFVVGAPSTLQTIGKRKHFDRLRLRDQHCGLARVDAAAKEIHRRLGKVPAEPPNML